MKRIVAVLMFLCIAFGIAPEAQAGRFRVFPVFPRWRCRPCPCQPYQPYQPLPSPSTPAPHPPVAPEPPPPPPPPPPDDVSVKPAKPEPIPAPSVTPPASPSDPLAAVMARLDKMDARFTSLESKIDQLDGTIRTRFVPSK